MILDTGFWNGRYKIRDTRYGMLDARLMQTQVLELSCLDRFLKELL
jgi:hypothetical protein